MPALSSTADLPSHGMSQASWRAFDCLGKCIFHEIYVFRPFLRIYHSTSLSCRLRAILSALRHTSCQRWPFCWRHVTGSGLAHLGHAHRGCVLRFECCQAKSAGAEIWVQTCSCFWVSGCKWSIFSSFSKHILSVGDVSLTFRGSSDSWLAL